MEPYKQKKDTPTGVIVSFGGLIFALLVGIFGGLIGLDKDAMVFGQVVAIGIGFLAISKWNKLAKQ